MMYNNEINYNNNICNNEHFVQRAAESPRRETPRGRNEENIIVFPNPTDGMLTIQYPENKLNKTIFIYDILGRERLKQELPQSQSKYKFSVEEFPIGIYTYKVIIENSSSFTGKILKQ